MNRKINSVPINRIKIGVQDRRTIMEKHIMEVKKRHFKLDDMVGMEILKYLYYRILRIWLSMIHQ